jgi:hypothetical protein
MKEYRRRIDAIPGARACPVCGRRATEESCGDAACRSELESRSLRIREDRERRERKGVLARQLEQELRSRGDLPDSAAAALLPATDRPLRRQDPARRTLFAERLADLMETAAADPDGPTGERAEPERPPTEDERLIGAACGSCRGHCCRHGEDHAFLRPATLRRHWRAHPELTPQQVREEYLRRLPDESVAGSCIYHGRGGCALPRAMRSDVCNRYHCEDLEALRKTAGAGPVLVLGFDKDRYVRASLLDGGGVRTVAEAPRAAE